MGRVGWHGGGDQFTYQGHRFEVIDMDRHRIDKVMIRRVDAAATPGSQA